MKVYKMTIGIIASSLLFLINVAFAKPESSIEFFASNNDQQISMQTAYSRLTGKEQHALQDNIIHVLQKYHMEQGSFEDILGTYQMSGSSEMTADNTEHFNTSPYQHPTEEKISSIAKELANTLNQESIAVFIPNQSGTGNIIVNFNSNNLPSINEIITILHDKLPPLYSQAFSLYLTNTCNGFDNAKVAHIEWLGSKINLGAIEAAFPMENITVRHGNAFLIYKNGKRENL